MEFKGCIKNISRDFATGKAILMIETSDIDELKANYGKVKDLPKLRIKVEKWAEKRSLNANAYFHLLVDKIAKATGLSSTRTKNDLLADYGAAEIIGDDIVLLETTIEPDVMLERDGIHCKVYGYTESKIIYQVIKPTRAYTTEEMSRLISKVVELADEMGIETLPPSEIERMLNLWKAS